MGNQQKIERRQFMVDREVQHGLVRRMLSYLCATWFAIFALPILVQIMTTKLPFEQLAAELFSDVWFPMVMSFLIFPLLAWDSVRFSNRVAGPVYRISNSMRSLVNGDDVPLVKLRKGDFCTQLADDFNRVLELHQSNTQQQSEIEQEELVSC